MSLPVMIGLGVASAGLSAWGAHRDAKAAQAAGSARIALIRKQQEFKKKAFEYETFSNFISTEQAGAERINQALTMGSSSTSVAALNRFDRFLFGRDLAGRELGLEQEMMLMEGDIKAIEEAMPDPNEEMWRSFLTTGLSSGLSMGLAARGGK